ncbi:Holliday junction branch migration protein RuvA [Robertkochia aurantiaca]|uniref:Holliday junction branch migration protein RuvA n=1 Tax=Robertkochia aurantiaca TaxID=2873700 RepID=UPI001CCCC268|nr:Holliday junction branch migration protein RuvA [Robertkochia sp. 3YJGBD-33]
MISQLNGRLIEKNPTDVVIDCNGVGYAVHISLYTYEKIGQEEALKLYTHLIVREDSQTLYGFFDKAEREVFRLLISVSGIGAGTARTMLSSLEPLQIRDAIVNDDVATIKSVKGIGAKTAQRLIIDLRDKVLKLFDEETIAPAAGNRNKEEALSALEVLGYPRKQAEKTVSNILKKEPDLSVENIIKTALKNL